jgi:PmbA protein
MAEQLLDQALQAVGQARRAGADEVVARIAGGWSTEFVMRQGQVEKVQQSASRSLQLRLYVEGRYSTHATSDLRPEVVAGFVADAVALTRHLQADDQRLIPDPALYEDRAGVDLDLYDPAVENIQRETCLEWLGAMDQAAGADSRVISASTQMSYGHSEGAQASSNGFSGVSSGTTVGYGGSVTLDEGDGRRPEASRYVRARHLEDLPPPAEVAAEALDRALKRLGSAKAPSARTCMVVAPEAGGSLLGHLVGALSGQAIQQDRSFLVGRQGERVAADILHMSDQPLLRRGLGSRLFDSEGVASRPFPVFEAGVLRHYYVDTYYGRKLGWKPTTGGPSNVVLAPGKEGGGQGLEQLLAAADTGFYVTSWLGGNADGTSGDFSFGFRGFRLEGGRIGGPVSEMNITGNYSQLLERLEAVGDDAYAWSSWHTPTLVFADVEFSGV